MYKATTRPFFANWIDWNTVSPIENNLPLDYHLQLLEDVPNYSTWAHKRGKLLDGKIPSDYPKAWKDKEGKVFIFAVAIDNQAEPILGSNKIAAPCPPFCEDIGG